jgi:cysteine desulfuration protein SufE
MNSLLEQVKEDFALVDDQRERLELMVEYGKKLPDFPAEKKTARNRVPGCVSGVYIDASFVEGKMQFSGVSESLIVKGYVYILLKALSGLSPREVLDSEEEVAAFISSTGISKSLIASRANAFGNVYVFMKEKAQGYLHLS